MDESVSAGNRKLENKVAIITGAGSGIGRETALLFSAEGATVIVFDIDQKGGSETVEMIKQKHGKGIFFNVDVSSSAHLEDAVEKVMDKYKQVDILVNNTGIFTEGSVIDTTEQDWNRLINVNLTGMFLTMKFCIPKMLESGGGNIVNVSSEAGISAISNQVAYNVTKSGVISLTKSTALDFADKNIRVNCVCPGRSLTPLVQHIIDSSDDPEATVTMLSSDRPLKRMGKPIEIARGILFFASDDAPYALGSILSIDGGYTIG